MSQGDRETVTLTREELQNLVRQSVHETLTSLGIDSDDPMEMQRDFKWLREFRQSAGSLKQKSVWAIIFTLISGGGALLVMGLKTLLSSKGG